MSIIKNNPFRILGLPANSKEKIIQKQISLLKKFVAIEKEKSFEYDFPLFGELNRTLENIQLASSRIEQMPQRIHNALFWFINKSTIDETAIDYLKDGDIDKAIDIWQKTLKEEITDRNYASYANLSTLFIGVASANALMNKQLLQRGIELKSKLLSSERLQLFVSDITRNEIVPDLEKLNSDFVNEIIELTKPYLENKQILPKEMIGYFSSFPANIKKIVLSKFADTHIYNIENEIEKTIEKRKASPRDAEEHGEALYKNTKKDIKELKKIFGKDNIQFQMIANKVANELIQCSIDFFNTHREEESEFDPGEDALRIAKYANSVGATGQVKNRIIENTQSIQEWVDSKEDRKQRKQIEPDIVFVLEQLRLLNETEYTESDTISLVGNNIDETNLNKADKLLNRCIPKLNNIYKVIEDDELFFQLSSAVVHNSLELVINTINKLQDEISKTDSYLERSSALKRFDVIIEMSVELVHIMCSIDVYEQLKQRLKINREIIWKIANQINVSTATRKSKEEQKRKKEIEQKEQELKEAKSQLLKIQNKQFLADEISSAKAEMNQIKEWQLFRKQETREQQITNQQNKINSLLKRAQKEKTKAINKVQEEIFKLEIELNNLL